MPTFAKSLVLGFIAFFFIAWLITACSSSGRRNGKNTEKPRIVVSIGPQIFFVRNIAGDRVEVSSLLGGSSDPETFEPSVAQFKELEDADAYLPLGTLPFESGVKERMKQSRRKTRIFDVSSGVELLYETHGHNGHSHNVPDPHIWSSPVNAKTMALNTLDALVAVDPANENVYRSNYARLDARLDAIDSSFRKAFDSIPTAPTFMVWHPSLSYFARDYGLKQLALNDMSKETSVKGYIDRLNEAREAGASVYFYQQEFDASRTESIAKETGVKVVEISPMNEEWEDEMQKLYDAFTTDKP